MQNGRPQSQAAQRASSCLALLTLLAALGCERDAPYEAPPATSAELAEGARPEVAREQVARVLADAPAREARLEREAEDDILAQAPLGEAPVEAPSAPPPGALARGGSSGAVAGFGGLALAGGSPVAAVPRTARAAPSLPQSGVLASNFVGGSGAQARLEDLLERGVLVSGQHVRLEAFDELGRLPYAVPSSDAVALHADLERRELRVEGERVHLQIALMARQGELPARPRMDVRLVIDRSGSMQGEKWTHAIAAAHALVERLREGDTFGLVSYSDAATIDLRPARVADRRAAHAAIDRLEIGGGTNIDAALEAVEQVRPERRRPSDVLLVVLLSDGVANVGQTNPDMLAARARGLFDRAGILTTTLGVGTDFDERTMLAIAREGSGSYHFVRRSADVARILTDELEERAQAVAQNLRLRIELAPGVRATRVYGSRLLAEDEARNVRATEIATDQRLARELGIARDRQRDDERGLRMHFPTFRRGDQHVVLMELEVPPGTDPASIARVSLDWKDLGRERNDHAAVAVAAPRARHGDAALASTVRQVKRTVLAFQAADALQAAAEALDRGSPAEAERAIAERIELLRAARDLWRDRGLDDDLRILESYQRVLASAWPGWGQDSQRTLVMAMNYYGDRRMR
jgi:Ca-activated chloride channel homolog